MQLTLHSIVVLALARDVIAIFSGTGPFPKSQGVFSSTFAEPSIPEITTELQGSFVQHKWDYQLSHITSGYWYNSASQGKVRVDEAYDGAIASSFFDYTNTTHSGEISNRMWTIGPSVGSKPQCFSEYISSPGFPLVVRTLLQEYNATFGGIVNDPLVGASQTWDFLFGGSISVTVYLDTNKTLLGYDFWGEYRRTKVITRFFNIGVGAINSSYFQNFPC